MLGKYTRLAIVSAITCLCLLIAPIVTAQLATSKSLYISYPPANYQTGSERIFIIGSAPSAGKVSIDNKSVPRSPKGHFASAFELKVGKNKFEVDYQGQTKEIVVTRTAASTTDAPKNDFAPTSLEPQGDMARMPGELVCFGANALAKSKVKGQDIDLKEHSNRVDLPDNKTALIDRDRPQAMYGAGQYLGCAIASAAADLGNPTYKLETGNLATTVSQAAPGKIEILSPTNLEIAEVNVEGGITRTGAGSDFSRLTPLPKGTRAAITARQTADNNGKSANWVRLDYGGWMLADQVNVTPGVGVPPKTIVKSITSKEREGATDVIFPLQVPVPMTIEQGTGTVTLTLYNTTAQTDIIRFNDNPVVSRLDWKQSSPGVVQYVFNLKSKQQWGYKLRYQGNNLVLSLRHPPKLDRNNLDKPLTGTKILLDPGHGGKDSGAVGPNGYTEKDANLYASKLLANELAMRGASVYLSREVDKFIELSDRQTIIDNLEPTIALSVHHNSIPEGGNPDTNGFSTFWYQAQAQSLAMSIHDRVVKETGRPSYGVFWDNLALARPASAPSVLLELGFMSNLSEFELIADPLEQQKMAKSLANSITQWLVASAQQK